MVRNRPLDNRRTSGFLSRLAKISLRPSCSQKQDVPPTQEDHQAQFYNGYRKVAEEYDKEFLKKHDEDLNTTLIFVSSSSSPDGSVLIRVPGRSFLCRHLRVHRPTSNTILNIGKCSVNSSAATWLDRYTSRDENFVLVV